MGACLNSWYCCVTRIELLGNGKFIYLYGNRKRLKVLAGGPGKIPIKLCTNSSTSVDLPGQIHSCNAVYTVQLGRAREVLQRDSLLIRNSSCFVCFTSVILSPAVSSYSYTFLLSLQHFTPPYALLHDILYFTITYLFAWTLNIFYSFSSFFLQSLVSPLLIPLYCIFSFFSSVLCSFNLPDSLILQSLLYLFPFLSYSLSIFLLLSFFSRTLLFILFSFLSPSLSDEPLPVSFSCTLCCTLFDAFLLGF